MNCPMENRNQEMLVAYAAGELDRETAAAVERHLAACPACRSLAAEQAARLEGSGRLGGAAGFARFRPAPLSPHPRRGAPLLVGAPFAALPPDAAAPGVAAGCHRLPAGDREPSGAAAEPACSGSAARRSRARRAGGNYSRRSRTIAPVRHGQSGRKRRIPMPCDCMRPSHSQFGWAIVLAAAAAAGAPRSASDEPGAQTGAPPARNPIDRWNRMSPEERERELAKLPPERARLIRERIRRYNQLPPRGKAGAARALPDVRPTSAGQAGDRPAESARVPPVAPRSVARWFAGKSVSSARCQRRSATPA